MGFMDPIVTINKPLWRRIEMLVAEVAFIQDGDELRGLDLEVECQKFVRSVVEEYIRQYFEESTRSAAQLLMKKNEKAKVATRYWLT